MTDPTEWPAYDIGPRESVFALGVASGNYARSEVSFGSLFARVLGISNDQGWERMARNNNWNRIRLIRDQLQQLSWPHETKNKIRADDMRAYYQYGMALNNSIDPATGQMSTAFAPALPNQPPALPQKLSYSSGPIAMPRAPASGGGAP